MTTAAPARGFRYGLIGAGMVAGTFHAASAAARTYAVTDVHVRSEAGRARAAAAHGVAVHETLGGLLSSGVDAVICATPPDARAHVVGACSEARMPLLAEKPLERTADAAAALVARMGDVPHGVVLQHRMRPEARAARALVADGALGRPRLLRIDVPWWREPSYYAEPGRGTHARDGGGVLITQGIHAIDLGLWIAGAAPRRVTGWTARALHDLEAEDTAVAGLEMDGCAGVITATTAARPGRAELVELVCERATLRLRAGRLETLHADGLAETHGAPGASGADASGSGADPMDFGPARHGAVMADFAEAVREGRPPAIPARAALRVQRVIDAIALSAREGRVVDIREDTS